MLMAFLLALSAAGLANAALLGMARDAWEGAGDAGASYEAASAASAEEAALNGGGIRFESCWPAFRIQGGSLLMPRGEKSVEARGVFIHDEAEPS